VHRLTPAEVSLALQILQGLLTPVIGMTTLYIAWQQWKANERKAVLDRYERRLRIYQRVVEMFRFISRDYKPQFEDLMKFGADTAEADFLFGPEIREYLDEIFNHGLRLREAHINYRDFTQPPPAGYDHQKVVNAITQEERWFDGQFPTAKEKFKKYLDVSR
jgi:hypothetical protein